MAAKKKVTPAAPPSPPLDPGQAVRDAVAKLVVGTEWLPAVSRWPSLSEDQTAALRLFITILDAFDAYGGKRLPVTEQVTARAALLRAAEALHPAKPPRAMLDNAVAMVLAAADKAEALPVEPEGDQPILAEPSCATHVAAELALQLGLQADQRFFLLVLSEPGEDPPFSQNQIALVPGILDELLGCSSKANRSGPMGSKRKRKRCSPRTLLAHWAARCGAWDMPRNLESAEEAVKYWFKTPKG